LQEKSDGPITGGREHPTQIKIEHHKTGALVWHGRFLKRVTFSGRCNHSKQITAAAAGHCVLSPLSSA
jgi:hypothetical protein